MSQQVKGSPKLQEPRTYLAQNNQTLTDHSQRQPQQNDGRSVEAVKRRPQQLYTNMKQQHIQQQQGQQQQQQQQPPLHHQPESPQKQTHGLQEDQSSSYIIQQVLDDTEKVNVIFDGFAWTDVDDGNGNGDGDGTNNNDEKSLVHDEHLLFLKPPPARLSKNEEDDNIDIGDIFVSLPTLNDGELCGETLFSLYNNALNPSKIHVGLVEQNSSVNEETCVEHYCKLQLNKNSSSSSSATATCPYKDQISVILLSTWLAKGKSYARALSQRKLLSNQQFCMSIDSHSKLIDQWDDIAVKEWSVINNEFAVLSNQPALLYDQKNADHDALNGANNRLRMEEIKNFFSRRGGLDDRSNIIVDEKVLFQHCLVLFNSYAIPYYSTSEFNQGKPLPTRERRKHFQAKDERTRKAETQSKNFATNGLVKHITKPLLSYSWSSSFSFSKCHLDTNVPIDNFITQLYDTDRFSRYARMFTRGYDVYLPTRNIVYHDYFNMNNVPSNGVTKYSAWRHDEMEKMQSIMRAQTLLDINTYARKKSEEQIDQANFGIYGIGKLRSLNQLEKFTGIDLSNQNGNNEQPTCSHLQWVPYQIHKKSESLLFSSTDNFYTNPSNLDPQPIFPKRINVSGKPMASYYEMQSHLMKQIPSNVSTGNNITIPVYFIGICLIILLIRKRTNGDYVWNVRNVKKYS